jgi:hypothetical protein
MKWFSFSLKVVVLGTVTLLFGSLLAGETSAQYPPPVGSATLAGSGTTASVGGTTELTLTVVDSTGSPIADKACTLYIFSQPGADASVTQDSDGTDADGVISGTLYAGTTRGIVEVRANCGNVFAGISVMVGSAAAPPQAPVEPGQIALPATGVGPAMDGEPYGLGLIVALLAGGLLTLATGSVLFRSARKDA